MPAYNEVTSVIAVHSTSLLRAQTWKGDLAMIETDIALEEPNIFDCELSDEALETAADVERKPADLTWYYCPTGLIICRV
jgi:hypothetical protein